MQKTDSSGESLSFAQIFNCSKFRRKIKDGTLGLLPPWSPGRGRTRFALCFAGWWHFHLDSMACEILLQKITHKGRENYKLQNFQRQESGGECVICEQNQGTTGYHGAKAEGCQRHGFDMCCVVQYNENTAGRSRLDTNSSRWDSSPSKWTDGVCAQWQLQEPFEEGETSVRPTNRLLQSPWYTGWTGRRDLSLEQTGRQNKLASISPFLEYPIPFTYLLFTVS